MRVLLTVLCALCLWSAAPCTSQAANKIRFSPEKNVTKPIRANEIAVRFSKKKDYTESWILWGWNKEGYSLYAVFVITRMVLGTRFGVMLTIRDPKGKVRNRMVDYKKHHLRWRKDHLDIQIHKKHRVKGTPNSGSLLIDFKNIGCNLRYKSTGLSGFRPQGGAMYFGKKKFIGLTYAPRLKVTGKIRVAGKTIPFRGMGYTDHSWQDIMQPHMARRWYGARAYNKDYTVITTHLLAPKSWTPNQVPGLHIAKGNKWIYHGSYAKLTYKESAVKYDKVTGYYPPRAVQYTAKTADGTKIKVEIRHKKLYNRLDVLSQFNFILRFLIQKLISKPFLFRYRTHMTLSFTKDGKTRRERLKGFAEWAYINP